MISFARTRAALAGGEWTAVDVLEGCLDRIDGRNGEVNALVTMCEERASRAARDADLRRGAGQVRLLDGIAFSVKDVIPVGDVRMTAGSRIFEDFVPSESATVVARLEAEGAMLLGKANCPEFGLDPHTDNLLFGPTKNPVDPDRTPGGSSGGDAAAVASDFVSFGIGSDYGGSIRWPAHCTGTVGFRPTAGLVPGTGHFPFITGNQPSPPNSASFFARVQTIAPVARSVVDAWAVLSVLCGPDGIDSLVCPVPLGDPSVVTLAGMRCAWATGEGTVQASPETIAAVRLASDALAGLGMVVVEDAPPGLEECEEIYASYRAADGLDLIRPHVTGRAELLTETMRTWFDRAVDAQVSDFQSIAAARDRVRASVLAYLESHPVLLLPVATDQAYEVGTASFDERFRTLAPCRAISLLGLPSCAVPVAMSSDGMPLAVQIVGRPFCDHEVAAVADALEESFNG